MILNTIHPEPYMHNHPHGDNPEIEGIVYGLGLMIIFAFAIILFLRRKKRKQEL